MAQDAQGRIPTNWKLPFFTIWTGQQLSLIGSMLAGFALVWWLTQSTGSATVLATATLVQMLPGILLGPFVGALVDRWNRRAVMIVADTLIALFSAWLAYLFWANALQIWHVYLISVVRAIGGAFHWPAMSASTSLMVPDKHLARVAGINQATRGMLNIAAPPLGALLLGLLPLHGIMAIDVVSAAFAVVPLFFVHIPQPRSRPTAVQAASAGATAGARPSLWNDVREGLGYVWSWSGLRATLIMAMVINFVFTPAGSLMPILVTRRFAGGAAELGWMESAWGAGVVLGGLTLSVWGGFKRRIVTTLAGLIGMGCGALLVGLSPATAFWMALAAMLVTGFMNPITNGPVEAIFQSAVAPEMQGRVFSVIGSASSAMAPLGMAIAGPVADAVGVHAWFLVSGLACASMGIVGFLSPAVMHIEENRVPPVSPIEGTDLVPAAVAESAGAD
jgi:DHA3 family macrolide efflux protein-like MFS transporter